ncbi:MAG: alpha/beta fold hydrolase, partial [Calditrichota bacterium]
EVFETYRPPRFLWNGHLQTIFPNLTRKVEGVQYDRERINTPDSDFLDLDWSRVGSDSLVVVSHGLEGSAQREYVLGIAWSFNRRNVDMVGVNCRGCSGEPNRLLRYYNSGSSDDLHTALLHISETYSYKKIALVGFSMGGNITLKYLGEQGKEMLPELAAAAVFSVPCDLGASCRQLQLKANYIYRKRFLLKLREKVRIKMELMPGQISDENYSSIKSLADFDDRYTAPLHGYTSADDYYNKCSSKHFIPHITLPTLIVNAKNDPFLPNESYPLAEAEGNPT